MKTNYKVIAGGAHDPDGKEIPIGTQFSVPEGTSIPGALVGKVALMDVPNEDKGDAPLVVDQEAVDQMLKADAEAKAKADAEAAAKAAAEPKK